MTVSKMIALALAGLAFTASGAQAVCIGNCGTLGANGVVTASPLGGDYQYVSTNNGISGAGSLSVGSETNGSLFTTATFTAAAGDALQFYFNYVTSDGAGFADYGFSQLQTASGHEVATLFTARTRPAGAGNVVPGFGLPGLLATLEPATTPIISGAPAWSPLGGSSGTCFDDGCGYTGWIKSTYTIASAGTYQLAFGVTNWSDTNYDTGLAFDGVTVAGNPIPGSNVPEPAAWAMLTIGFGLVGATIRRRCVGTVTA